MNQTEPSSTIHSTPALRSGQVFEPNHTLSTAMSDSVVSLTHSLSTHILLSRSYISCIYISVVLAKAGFGVAVGGFERRFNFSKN